jgi:hypothetical protein
VDAGHTGRQREAALPPRCGAQSGLNPPSGAVSGFRKRIRTTKPGVFDQLRRETQKNAGACRSLPKWRSHFGLAACGRSPPCC